MKHIGLVRNDPWLEPFENAIVGRHEHTLYKIDELTAHGKQTLSEFADGYLYFGLHRTEKGWVFRVWGVWWSVGIVWFISGFTAWLRYLYKREKGQIEVAE